ncbi:hypothetical protein BS47DRAFT_1361477 [Hydnum rufescens UP504]|uniref:Uncharacterized protein n=1 Tax=Hydnum rufescens UP504 TaxID=1448309 RepID=A0A9P6AZV6_9AGAM|nr:hypothetical protein BS47DRAFT_1361477 [Hydnum rufescens UP504]
MEKFDDAFVLPSRFSPMRKLGHSTHGYHTPQLCCTVKGTKATWVKFGEDAQEDQLKLNPRTSTAQADFGVEPKENEGLLTTEQGGLINTHTVPTTANRLSDRALDQPSLVQKYGSSGSGGRSRASKGGDNDDRIDLPESPRADSRQRGVNPQLSARDSAVPFIDTVQTAELIESEIPGV